MTCTIPRIFGFDKWFNSRFSDLCDTHDDAYVTRVWGDKVVGDFAFCASMAARGYITLAFACFAFFSLFGTLYWAWKKYKQLFKRIN